MYGSQTPIDIHCSKLMDWLVQRRHCKKDWGENLAAIRRKIRVALVDMPENEEIKELLIGSKLDYFKSKKIFEMLKTIEAGSKNIFGYYTSQRMKDWQDIVYSYERDSIYLAELATDLIRETNYEVPSIKKLINNLKKEKAEAEKEKANLIRKAQQFSSEHHKLSQTYGTEQIKTLSTILDEIVSESEELRETLEHYQSKSLTKRAPVLATTNALLLAERKARNRFLNNLYEIEAFYNQLSFDLDQEHKSEEMSEILVKTRRIMSIMNKEKNRILFQMSDSPSFVESIQEKLEKKEKQASDCKVKAELLDEKISNIDNQIRETELQLKKCIMSAKELQDKVENSIRDLYSGRTINIMGCVN